MPDALVIQADATHTHEGKSGDVCFCEFSEKKLFRRLQLPASVDVDKVTASVDKGILEVTAPKATTKQMTVGA
jgi:HSP20 family molecular chaperone IbpA